VNTKCLENLLLKPRSWCIVVVLQTEPTNINKLRKYLVIDSFVLSNEIVQLVQNLGWDCNVSSTCWMFHPWMKMPSSLQSTAPKKRNRNPVPKTHKTQVTVLTPTSLSTFNQICPWNCYCSIWSPSEPGQHCHCAEEW